MIPEIKVLYVLYRNSMVGTIQKDGSTGACVFEYDKEWLADGFSISPTELPLKSGLFVGDPEKFGGGFAVFEDSMPDGYGLFLLDRILKKQGSSLKELSVPQILSIIGTAGMGALMYVPEMPGIGRQKEVGDPEALELLQSEALKVLSEKGEGDEALLYYNSANSGGARPKVVARRADGTHWIVKFRHVYDSESIGREEYLYMQTAGECGITIPRIELINDKYFAIERFDIDRNGERIHTLTASALLKTDFKNQSADYTNLLALTGFLTQDPVQVEEMFRRMVFNIVAINKDDHAKNFSFLCIEGKWSLAPAYDITYSPQGTNGEHATSVFYHGDPSLEDVLKAGTEIRIPKARCLEIISKIEDICSLRLPLIHKLS